MRDRSTERACITQIGDTHERACQFQPDDGTASIAVRSREGARAEPSDSTSASVCVGEVVPDLLQDKPASAVPGTVLVQRPNLVRSREFASRPGVGSSTAPIRVKQQSWTEGPHTVECHAVDMVGNKSQRTAVTFSVVNAYASPAPAQHLAPGY